MPDNFDVTVVAHDLHRTEKGSAWKVTLENKVLGYKVILSVDEVELHNYKMGSFHHVSLKNPQTTLEQATPQTTAPTEEQILMRAIGKDQRDMTDEEKAAFGIDGDLGKEHEASEEEEHEEDDEES